MAEHKVNATPQKRESDGTLYYDVECTCGERWEQSNGPFKCPKEAK